MNKLHIRTLNSEAAWSGDGPWEIEVCPRNPPRSITVSLDVARTIPDTQHRIRPMINESGYSGFNTSDSNDDAGWVAWIILGAVMAAGAALALLFLWATSS